MSKHHAVEPNARNPTFSVTWAVTLKCNLDCSYCGKTGHNNALPHPPLDECKQTIDFLVQYIDLYMMKKSLSDRYVAVNIFGGESLFHPNIVEILNYFEEKYQPYKDKWSMGLNTISNVVVKDKIWNKIVDKFNFWTVSYHIESTTEQQALVRKNILDLKQRNKKFHVSLLMHPKYWKECLETIEWCNTHQVKVLPRQIDHHWNQFQYWYSKDQAEWMRGFHSSGHTNKDCGSCNKPTLEQKVKFVKESVIKFVNLNDEGRQCCGGASLHVDQDYANSQTHVDNTFKGWSCSVNYFFVYVDQTTKEIFVNKDCQVNFEGKVGPIGYTDNYQPVLDNVLTAPTITCVKKRCLCGICTPKSSTKEEYDTIIKKYLCTP